MERRDVSGSANRCNHYEKQDPATPFLGIYPKEMYSTQERDTCTAIYIIAPLTTAKICNQPKDVLSNKWIKQM